MDVNPFISWKSREAKVVAVHPLLLDELRIRKDAIEEITGRKTEGGITCFSEMAAMELRALRESSEKITREISKMRDIPINKFNVNGKEEQFIPYDIYKKVLIFISVLSRKKDQSQIKVEITKIRGLKKNEVKYLW